MILFALGAVAGVIFGGLMWYAFFQRREKRVLERVDGMIAQAEKGRLDRSEISENKISAVEEHLKHFLDNSTLSADEQQRQKELIQSLISDIAHQTLTPVSNLKLYTELLREQQQSGFTDTIQEQTDKLDFLIQSLVKLSRMENGIISVQPKRTAVQELLDRTEREFSARAAEKNIALRVEKTDVEAVFDLKWTSEALGNIADNAIKYSDGGSVRISVQPYSFFARIDISDDGMGIREAETAQIFSRFYRSVDVSDREGVGIGLYLAREIVQAQGGYIKVSSVYGEGSTFSVFLPTETR